ncbi:hypothetical protein COU23_01755 [Candidatus Kuenenbacteria bacterium CG10_big_fil_rev_8_21_14_0_10_36_11]|uniref:Uncharacterized protein n=1 Tax=Candidatus Kuenenbacteria bacterium CG10_big_fil_rev_8_21_14_0_10_36_11 TaxID=1974618 RepID=A0A2M6WAP2_9BACT|nr:MAG: hypothetical protein COU23_01755 [Candidatus Kuenenbacteria bacterium CG10_big_fil_rev_8_21_14_0_10_36_11]
MKESKIEISPRPEKEKIDVSPEKNESQELYKRKREMIANILNEIDQLENFDFSEIASRFKLNMSKKEFLEKVGGCVKPISNVVEIDLPILKKVALQLHAGKDRSWTYVYMLAKLLGVQELKDEQEGSEKVFDAKIGNSCYIDEKKVAEEWFSLGSVGGFDFNSDPEFFASQPYQKKEIKELSNQERMEKEIEYSLNSWRQRTKEPFHRINQRNGYGSYVPKMLFENPFDGDEETEFLIRVHDVGSSVDRESKVKGITAAEKETDKLGWEVYNDPRTNKNARVREVISAEGLRWVRPVWGENYVSLEKKREVL